MEHQSSHLGQILLLKKRIPDFSEELELPIKNKDWNDIQQLNSTDFPTFTPTKARYEHIFWALSKTKTDIFILLGGIEHRIGSFFTGYFGPFGIEHQKNGRSF